MINLEEKWLQVVKEILKNHVPQYRVVVFGSRIKEKTKPYSDLDLCIMTTEPLSLSNLGNLKEAFSNSDLPIRVDIVDWAATSSEFQAVIQAHCETLE